MSRPVDPRLLRAAPTMRRYLAGLVLADLVGAGLLLAQAMLLASSIVTVFVHHEFGTPLTVRLLALALVGLGRAAVAAYVDATSARASLRVRAQLRQRTLDAIRQLGPVWAGQQEAGRLANATGPGLDGLDGYLARALPAVVNAAITTPLALLAIGIVDWQSGLLLLVMLPLVPVFMALVGVTTKRRVQRQYVLLGRLAGQFLDLLRGLTTLRIYGQAQRQERTLAAATERYRRETMSALRVTFLSALVLDLVAALSVAVVAVDVGLRLDSGNMAFLAALIVLLLAPEVFTPLRAMGAQFHANIEGATAAAACLDVIDTMPAVSGQAARAKPVVSSGAVALDGVSVRYEGREVAALDRVHLNVQPGELVVLQGTSGAGKSTVLGVLLGYVRPDAGSVIIGVPEDLVDLSELDPRSWRRNVAWVPQRPRPTQQTVAAEVHLGDRDATDAEVAAACAACRTPDPATPLGEDGRWVSAGQRRRIAVARALLRARSVHRGGGVPVVLLDEPSEDLDPRTEAIIASVIASMRGWATVIVATHSQRLAAMAQRRIVIAHGHIVANQLQAPQAFDLDDDEPGTPSPPDTASTPGTTSTPGTAAAGVSAAPTGSLRLRDITADRHTRRRLLLAATLSALAGLAGLALTASSTWLISRAAQHPNVQALSIAVVGVRTFALGRAGLRYLERLASHDAALRLLTGLRVQVFGTLRRLGGGVLGGYARGDLLRRFAGDVDGVQDGLVRTFIPLAGAGATGLGAVVLAGLLAPAAGIVLAVALTVAGIALPWLALRASGHQADTAGLIGERDAQSEALTEGLAELIAYDADEPGVARVAELDQHIEQLSRRRMRASAGTTLAAGLFVAAALPLVLLAGAHAVRSGQLPVADLAVLAVCVIVGFEGVTPLPAAFAAWARCRAGLDRVGAILALAPTMPDPTQPAGLPDGGLGILARAIAVAPDAGAAPVLHDVNLEVGDDRRIAVMGPSGCGKSTLLAAVLRQLPIRAGSLDVSARDGGLVPLATIEPDLLPAGVAGSLQGDHIFDATLRDNLRVVRPDADDAALDAVAARAGLTDLIAELPDGWSTAAGADGVALSGGQRQRLLLARALLAAPQILVLDEPTAHLDAETERAVLRDLLGATAGRTVLLTTHRRGAAEVCDQVLHIVDGTVGAGVPAPAVSAR